MDHRIVMGTLSCVDKVHLVHVKPGQFDSVRGQENKNASRCDSQDLWQAAPNVENGLPKINSVDPARGSKLLFTVYDRHLLLLSRDIQELMWTTGLRRCQTQMQISGDFASRHYPGKEAGVTTTMDQLWRLIELVNFD